MYKIIEENKEDLKNRYTYDEIAEKAHLNRNYLNMIFNGSPCKFTTAFTLVKQRDKNAKLEDYFEKINDEN